MDKQVRFNDPAAENPDKSPSTLTVGELGFADLGPEQRGAISFLRFVEELKSDKKDLNQKLKVEHDERQALYERCVSLETEVKDSNVVRTQNEELVISNLASVVLTAIGGALISSGHLWLGWLILLWGISMSIFPVVVLKIKNFVCNKFPK